MAKDKEAIGEEKEKTCFVIMPISDAPGYDAGHFKRVYHHIIKPACEAAGFKPVRADDINTTNHIIIDILKRIIEADMAICDLSARNPNVLYELGIRQAFNKPVTLLKDKATERIFDIQGLRDVEYDSSLRVDKIEETVPLLAEAIKSTYESKEDSINSIIQLLGIQAAEINKTEISQDTNIVLNAIKSLSNRIDKIDSQTRYENPWNNSETSSTLNILYDKSLTVSKAKKIKDHLEKMFHKMLRNIEIIEEFDQKIFVLNLTIPVATITGIGVENELRKMGLAPIAYSWD